VVQAVRQEDVFAMEANVLENQLKHKFVLMENATLVKTLLNKFCFKLYIAALCIQNKVNICFSSSEKVL